MNQVAPLAAPRESLFVVLASSARRLSYGELSMIAAASGIAALAAAAFGTASWMLLSACYVAWCFAGWGILFHASTPRTLRWKAFEWTLVGSASAVCVILGVGVFFWALGPRWIL
jgi:hypothetical protein